MSQTASLVGVATFDNGFLSNEISDLFASHLDLNQFCTVDNELEGVTGDIRRINVYGASGTAEDVTEKCDEDIDHGKPPSNGGYGMRNFAAAFSIFFAYRSSSEKTQPQYFCM